MGNRSSPLVCYPPWDVSTHCRVRAEGGREVHLLMPLGQPAKAWPRGGPICHETCGILDFSQGDQGPLSQCLPVEKVSWSPAHCGPQQRREAIHDILSSLRNHLHWQVYPIAAKEDTRGAVNESRSRPRGREDPHEEALWEGRAAPPEGARGCPGAQKQHW